jgi:CubicO group peptidase (beta-lactamase class C family)
MSTSTSRSHSNRTAAASRAGSATTPAAPGCRVEKPDAVRNATPRARIRAVKPFRGAMVLVLGLSAALLVSPWSAAAHTPPTSPAVAHVGDALDTHAIDSFLAQQVHRHRIPGLAVGIVDHDRVAHLAGFGAADDRGHPVTPDTRFVLASVSKPVTATAVMQLAEARRVDLDAPVRRYLPGFVLADPEAAGAITVRQLLNHTSGLPVSACERNLDTIDGFVASLRSVNPAAPPGTRYAYCSGNYDVLGALVQHVTGEPFGAYLHDHVFGPLGMTRSSADPRAGHLSGLAQGHRWIFGLQRPMSYFNASGVPSGYVVSTARDMTRFLGAHLNGGTWSGTRLLSPASDAMMQHGTVSIGSGASYGLGWMQGRLGGVPATYHFGGNYDVETLAFMEPGTERGAILLVNDQGLIATDAFRSIEYGLARLLADRSPGHPTTPVPQLYGYVDAGLVVITTLLVLPLIRIRRWARVVAPERLRRGQRARVMWRVGLEVTLPILVLGVLGFLLAQLGATWSEMFLLVPDLMSWITLICGVALLTGAAHAIIAHHVWSHQQPNASVDPSEPSASRESTLAADTGPRV